MSNAAAQPRTVSTTDHGTLDVRALVLLAVASRRGTISPVAAAVATFVTTLVSGCIFMVIKMAMIGLVAELAAAMLPVVAATAVFNGILVAALYLPIKKALKLS